MYYEAPRNFKEKLLPSYLIDINQCIGLRTVIKINYLYDVIKC